MLTKYVFVAFPSYEKLLRCLNYQNKNVTGHPAKLSITPSKTTEEPLEAYIEHIAIQKKNMERAKKEAAEANRPTPSMASSVRSAATKRGLDKAIQDRVARLRAAMAATGPPQARRSTPTNSHTTTNRRIPTGRPLCNGNGPPRCRPQQDAN